MFKKTAILALFSTVSVFAQTEQDSIKKNKIVLFGGLESNSQWYLNDVNREINANEITNGKQIRSNSYLTVNANYGRFTAGVQMEAYEPNALLNYNPGFEGTNVGTYYANYKSKTLDITAGYFYEQFGSGLILRAWEDRSLGINTALRGGKVTFRPVEEIMLTGLYGRQRTGFHVSESDIFGFNSDFNVTGLLNIESFSFSTGFSVVVKNEAISDEFIEPEFNENTNAFAGRISLEKGNFYLNSEYNQKDKEPIFTPADPNENFWPVKDGNALLINFGYSKRGLGIDVTLRRLENMLFLAERVPTVYGPEQSSINFNDRIVNFTPALTKQHHSNLANIYVYQAQNKASMQFTENFQKFGEIGGQVDLFYEFKKGSSIGGKYGTKIAANISNWFNLDADYSYFDSEGNYAPDYDAKFFGGKEKYFHDYNLEVSKKLNSKFKGALMYTNQYYNDQFIRGISQENVIKTNILFAEGVYKLKGGKALTVGLEHMWADNDRGNWAAMLVEYNHNSNWSVFVMDMYNYGFDENAHLISETDTFDIHFYNMGAAYTKGRTRIAANYGRQRGGLVCAGGVCRFVPPSTGFGLSLSTSF